MSKSVQTTEGVEFGVEQNTGHFRAVDSAHGKRNALVSITVARFESPVTASIDTDDAALWRVAQEMWRTGGLFDYRIEIHRDGSIDPTIPFESVPKTKQARHRRLVWMEPAGPGGQAPAGSPSQPAPAPVPVVEVPSGNAADPRWTPQPAGGPPVCPLCPEPIGTRRVHRHEASGRFAHHECWDADRTGQPISAPPAAPALDVANPTPEIAHPCPLDAASDMVDLALGLLMEHRLAVGDVEPPPTRQVKALAARLLMAADKAQAKVRDDGLTNRMWDSHTRARLAVRTALKCFPVPWGEPGTPVEQLEGQRKVWIDQLGAYAAELVAAAIEVEG